MENQRVGMIMETIWNTEWQGADRDTGLLQSAVLCLCACGKITREEAVRARDTLQAERSYLGKEARESVFVTVTPDLAADTVLWVKDSAEEADEPFASVIRQAAEYLHDFWSEVLDPLPMEK